MDFVGRLDASGGDKASTAVVVLIVALVILIPLGVLAGFVAIVVLVVRSVRGHKRTRAQELEDLRRTVRDDLIALGEDIRALELDLQMPGANAEAQRAYASAVEAYERANRTLGERAHPARLQARRGGARGGPLRDAVGARGPGRPHAAGAPRAVLLRPAPRPVLA